MANWNLSKRLFVGVGSLVALLLVSGGVSFFTGRSMKAQLDGATKVTARQQELALQLQRDGVSLSNLQRGLLLAALGGDSAAQKQTQDNMAALRADMKKRFDEMDQLLASRERWRAPAREREAKGRAVAGAARADVAFLVQVPPNSGFARRIVAPIASL